VISGRAKDIIIRTGENIAPKEVEDLLCGHPQIAEVAIVGMPDPRTGERACAVIVPRPGSPGPDVPGLRTFLAEKGVAAFKFPRDVILWDASAEDRHRQVLKHRIRAALGTSATPLEQGIHDEYYSE
jgi:non-ribosomal peptide synthetase component E (peptide arylation enzyme)